MTNEEAIEVLQSIRERLLPSMTEEIEALDNAIEALKRVALVDKMTKAYYKALREELIEEGCEND